MTERTERVLARLIDLAVPGAGMLWAGRRTEGWNAVLAWSFLPSLMAASVALLDLDPRRAALALAVAWAAMQALLWLTPLKPIEPPKPARAVAGVLVFATLLGLAALSLSRSFTMVTVPDHAQWPGLLPGETVLVRRGFSAGAPPAPGDLVTARTKRGVRLARVVGVAGDHVEVSGPSLQRNGAQVAADDLGELRFEGTEAASPEAKGLRAWRERFAESDHLVFFARGVTVAPVVADVPEGQVFLLADNRSTEDASDSRDEGLFDLEDLVGRPETVLWSPGVGPVPRWGRIGARWP